jgi:hypothetical protein
LTRTIFARKVEDGQGKLRRRAFHVGGSIVIDVLRIPLSNDRLRAIPKEERALLFLLGYAANQITLFSKLVQFSSNGTPSDPVEQQLSDAQSLILGRVAIGVLAEAWELIYKRFLGTPRGKEFEPAKLNPIGREALETLKKHFSGSNILSKLRNNVTLHHPYDSHMDAGFEAAAAETSWDSDWNSYFSSALYNSWYFASNIVMLHAMLNTIGETDPVNAHQRIMSALKQVTEPMIYLIFAINEAILIKNLGPTMAAEAAEVVTKITNALGLFDVGVPFYVEMTGD